MYSRIVVGTDGTDRSLIAVDHAARLAAVCDAELHVVAVGPCDATATHRLPAGPVSARTAARIGHDAGKRHGVRIVEHPQAGEPAAVLMAVADSVGADLIVVGNQGMSERLRRFAGSVPSRLGHRSSQAVLIVHTG